jgi:hypothetical protein
MKTIICCIYAIIMFEYSFAQTKPKPKEKPPTQADMQKMMKEAQDMMNEAMKEMSPEDKKMMDSLGIKMPDIKSMEKKVSGISDADLKKAYDDDKRIVPLKDIVRINSALEVRLSNAEMSAYINKTNQVVLAKLSPATKAKGAEIYQQITAAKKSVANTAVGFWIDGKPTLALYLMGEACKTDPENSVNLNNYASFLSTCGAEQLALPILNNLNKRYPKNSSILNNITQAWLGLGDIAKAEKYADSTIRIYAYHPQTNMAKCLIEESKGNIPKAIEAAKKSIRKAYSTEKENKLKKLGYKLKSDDIDWNLPMPQDPMGLGKFTWPGFPMDVTASKSMEQAWKEFKNQCQEKIDELNIKRQKLEQEFEKQSGLRNQQIIHASQKGQYVPILPAYAAKAIIKLGPGVNDVNGTASFVFAKQLEPITTALMEVTKQEDVLAQKQKLINDKYKDQFGEGKPNPFDKVCSEENQSRTEFLGAVNGKLNPAYKSYLDYTRRKTSDLLYYYQYISWPEQYELYKVMAQISWLTQIKDQRVFFKAESNACKDVSKKNKKDTLQNFDDVACKYVSKLNLGVYKMIASCSNLTGEFDFGGLKINLKDNVETGRYSGSAMIGVSKGFDGPAGSEIETSIEALVEWDNTGITDGGFVAGAEAKVGGVTAAGADVRATINSGVSTSGKGILQGIK